jgi:hypothetical protein
MYKICKKSLLVWRICVRMYLSLYVILQFKLSNLSEHLICYIYFSANFKNCLNRMNALSYQGGRGGVYTCSLTLS